MQTGSGFKGDGGDVTQLWFSSDLHLSHANILGFQTDCVKCDRTGEWVTDGEVSTCLNCMGTGEVPMRHFSSVEEMDETLVSLHNSRVRPQDHWWFLGDLTMQRRLKGIEHLIGRMNGHKRIILGNHDIAPISDYTQWFEKVVSYRVIDNLMFSHIPIHQASMGRFTANIHGHIHSNGGGQFPPKISQRDGRTLIQPYINLSCEMTDYAPLSFEDVRTRVRDVIVERGGGGGAVTGDEDVEGVEGIEDISQKNHGV